MSSRPALRALALPALFTLASPARADVAVPAAPPAAARACPARREGRLLGIFPAAAAPAGSQSLYSIAPWRAEEIIGDELRRAGIPVTRPELKVGDLVRESVIRRYYTAEARKKYNLPLHSNDITIHPLQVGGVDPKTGVGYVVVHPNDQEVVYPGAPNERSPRFADLDALAAAVLERLAKQPEPRHAAVFLTPLAATDEESEAKLRAAVRDFVACLPAKR